MRFPPTRRLSSPLRTRDVGPTREAIPQLIAVRRRRQQMPSRAKVLGNRTIRGQKALGMPRRLEPWHAIFALACGAMGVFTAVVEVTTLPVFDPGQNLTLRRPVALEL